MQLINGIKYFRFWFRFRRDIRILVWQKLTLRRITESYCAQYHTVRSQKKKISWDFAKMKNVALFKHNLNIYLFFYETVPLKDCAKV